MTVALVLLALAALAALVAVGFRLADRVALQRAEQHAAQFLSAPLGTAARVQVHGSPFLTQAVRGRYGDVEVTASGLQIGVLGGTTLHAHLVDARLPLRDLLGRRANELPVDHVHGDLVVPYAELARVSPVPGLRFRYDGRPAAWRSPPCPCPGSARSRGSAVTRSPAWTRPAGCGCASATCRSPGSVVPALVLNQLLPDPGVPDPAAAAALRVAPRNS